MSNIKMIHNSHNVSILVYHVVCPTKNRREVVDETLRQVCEGIEVR